MTDVYVGRENIGAHTAVSNVEKSYKGTTVAPSLKDVAEHNTEILFKLKSVFPFDFFPATICIDLQKVNVIDRVFFWAKNTVSVPISEIFVVECDTSLFFATLRVKDKRFQNDPIEVRYLKKSEALEAQRIIQGLVAVHNQKLNMGGMSTDEIKVNAEIIGNPA